MGAYDAPMPTASFDDINIHYRQHGRPDEPPVLGIMGYGLDQRFWAAQIPAVTETHRFITFDNRAVGKSTGPVATSIDELADDAVMLLDHLEIEKTVVLGASMGGAIAQRLVLDHPDRVSALILAITWARPIEFMRRQVGLSRMIIDAGGSDAMLEAGLVRMFSPIFFEVGPEVIDRMMRVFEVGGGEDIASADILKAQLDAIEKHDTLAQLGEIDVPTLVVGGKMDMMVPYFAQVEIAEAIPGAELATFETGHGLMVEEMQEFNDRIGAFLAGLT